MCKSKAEGGARCYAHTNKAYQKSLEDLNKMKENLLVKKKYYAFIVNKIKEIETNQNSSTDINKERVYYYNKLRDGDKAIAHDTVQIAQLEKEVKYRSDERNATFTGLKILKQAIDNSNNTEEKRKLSMDYNIANRVFNKRKEAWGRHKKNQIIAQQYIAEAKEKEEVYQNMDIRDKANAEVADDLRVEAEVLRAKAFLAEHDGNMEAQTLYSIADGHIVPAKLIPSQYGKNQYAWLVLSDPTNPHSKGAQAPFSLARGATYASREEYYAKKGYVLGTAWVPGKVEVVSDENGNRKVKLTRDDGGFSPRAIRGNTNVYASLMKQK